MPRHDAIPTARQRLLAARGAALDDLGTRHGVRLMTLFGSAVDHPAEARDLDVAVLFAEPHGGMEQLTDLIVALQDLAGTERIDVMDLSSASVTARARGLGHGAMGLFEDEPGLWARERTAALDIEMDTAPLRRAQLELLARR